MSDHEPVRRKPLKDLQGAVRMVVDGVQGVVNVVESMHGTIQRFTLPVGKPPATRTMGIAARVYSNIRGGIDLVGGGLEGALGPWTDLITAEKPSPQRDAFLAVLNGMWGDYLWTTGNPLALPMSLSPSPRGDEARPADNDRLLILAHGLCMADSGWRTPEGHDHGARLAEELGLTPLYLQYNSGLPIHHNGRELAAMLEVITKRWPHPVRQIVLLGYSMGGLVIRSACHYADAAGYGWRSKLSDLVTLGTPHHGAPAERAGKWTDAILDVSAYSAPITRLTRRRSAGITDLGHGQVTEAPSAAIALPTDVRCFAVAGSRDLAAKTDRPPNGDGIVPIDSALGRHAEAARTLAFASDRQAVVYDVSHLGLLASEEACEQIRGWLAVS